MQRIQLEDGVEMLCQFVERHAYQFVGMLGKSVRQQGVERNVPDEQFVFSSLVAEDGTLIDFGDGSLGELVVRMGKQVECLNQQTDANRGVESECLIANDVYARNLLADIVGYQWNGVVRTH